MKYLNIISLVFEYIPVFESIEIGRITPAKPLTLRSCFILSTNRHSISELLSVKLSYNSNVFSPSFKVVLNASTLYGGFDIKISNCPLFLLLKGSTCFNFLIYSSDKKFASPLAHIIFASPSPLKKAETFAVLTNLSSKSMP